MNETASKIATVVRESMPAMLQIPESAWIARPQPGKWSKKEILGHLADSAQNNIRRLIVAQYEQAPRIVYDQDKWVASCNYQSYPTGHLVQLWQLLNKHLVVILTHLPRGIAEERLCETDGLHTLEWLASDYLLHLRHHLHQILDLDPVPYP